MTRLSIVLVLFLLPSPLVAQPPSIIDVIPKEASAALVLRSVDDFKTKGKQLLNDLDMQDPELPGKLVSKTKPPWTGLFSKPT